jgi:GNAT superfamily N-acetyltransferase
VTQVTGRGVEQGRQSEQDNAGVTDRDAAVNVRMARPDDRDFVLEAVARLSAFGVPDGRTKEEIVEAEARTLRAFFDRRDAPETLLVAEGDGRAAGFIFLEEKEDYFTGQAHGHIGIVVVTEQAEGRGAGAALMRAAEAWARSQGHSRLTLNVFDGNRRARAMYEHLGFRPDTVKYMKAL